MKKLSSRGWISTGTGEESFAAPNVVPYYVAGETPVEVSINGKLLPKNLWSFPTKKKPVLTFEELTVKKGFDVDLAIYEKEKDDP